MTVSRRDKGDALRRVDIRIQRADIIIHHAVRLSNRSDGRFDMLPLFGLTAIAKMRIRSPFFSESDRLKKPR